MNSAIVADINLLQLASRSSVPFRSTRESASRAIRVYPSSRSTRIVPRLRNTSPSSRVSRLILFLRACSSPLTDCFLFIRSEIRTALGPL